MSATTSVPHMHDVVRVMNRFKMGNRLVSEKILGDCVSCIITAAKRGETHTLFTVPCFKTGYPAFKTNEVRYWVLYQLLLKKFIVVPIKTNQLYIQWASDVVSTTTTKHIE